MWRHHLKMKIRDPMGSFPVTTFTARAQMKPRTSTKGHSTHMDMFLAFLQRKSPSEEEPGGSGGRAQLFSWWSTGVLYHGSTKGSPAFYLSDLPAVVQRSPDIRRRIFPEACWTPTISNISSSRLVLSILLHPSLIGGRNVAGILTECFAVLSRQMATLPWRGSPMETGPLTSSLFSGHTALAQQYGLALLH